MSEKLDFDASQKADLILRLNNTLPIQIQLKGNDGQPSNLEGYTYKLDVHDQLAPDKVIHTINGVLDEAKTTVSFAIDATFWSKIKLEKSYGYNVIRTGAQITGFIHGPIKVNT